MDYMMALFFKDRTKRLDLFACACFDLNPAAARLPVSQLVQLSGPSSVQS